MKGSFKVLFGLGVLVVAITYWKMVAPEVDLARREQDLLAQQRREAEQERRARLAEIHGVEVEGRPD